MFDFTFYQVAGDSDKDNRDKLQWFAEELARLTECALTGGVELEESESAVLCEMSTISNGLRALLDIDLSSTRAPRTRTHVCRAWPWRFRTRTGW